MKKKVLSILLMICLLCSLFPSFALDGPADLQSAEEAITEDELELMEYVPYEVTVDSVIPNTIRQGESEEITLLGENLDRVQSICIDGKDLEAFPTGDGSLLTFTVPPLSAGSYSITYVDAQTGNHMALQNAVLTCVDGSAGVSFGEITEGIAEYQMPVSVAMQGDVTAFYAVLSVPSGFFENIKAELSESVQALDNVPGLTSRYNERTGKLYISMAGSESFNVGAQPLLNLIFQAGMVYEPEDIMLQVDTVEVNGLEILDAPIAIPMTVYANYSLFASVRYFKGGAAIEGVKIYADNAEGITDENGNAQLNGIHRPDVTVYAVKNEDMDYVPHTEHVIGSGDALMILRSRVGEISLTKNQKLAADVDGNGRINEVDASLILRYAVGLITTFPTGPWRFAPSHVDADLAEGYSGMALFSLDEEAIGDYEDSGVVGYATTTAETIKLDSKGYPKDDDGDGWDWDGDTLTLDDEDLTFKISGTLKGDVEVLAGTLSSGTVSGDLTVLDDGTVSGGIYKGNITVSGGTISGGTFDGSLKSLTIEDGIVKGGTIKVTVKNEGGTISGGTFSGAVTNESVITGGTFSAAVTNDEDGKINAKKGTFKGAVKNYGLIQNGTFSGTVTNGDSSKDQYEDAELDGGTYDGAVNNYARIFDGVFNAAVTNYNTIEGGEFNETVFLKTSKLYSLSVDGGLFAGINFGSTKFDEDDLGYNCEFMVTAVNKGSGIISVPKTAEYGSMVTMSVTAPFGITLDSISAVDGNGNNLALYTKSNDYTFRMPGNGVTVTAVFSDYDRSSIIPEVRIYVNEPEYDRSLRRAFVYDYRQDYSILSTTWSVDGVEVGTGYYPDAGESAAVTINLAAAEEKGFDETTEVYLNGKKIENCLITPAEITIFKEYPPIGKTTHGHRYVFLEDSRSHWMECSCGMVLDPQAHNFDESGMCLVCDYECSNFFGFTAILVGDVDGSYSGEAYEGVLLPEDTFTYALILKAQEAYDYDYKRFAKIKVLTGNGELKIYEVDPIAVNKKAEAQTSQSTEQYIDFDEVLSVNQLTTIDDLENVLVAKLDLDLEDRVVGIRKVAFNELERDVDINKKGITSERAEYLADTATVFSFDAGIRYNKSITDENNWSVVKRSAICNNTVEYLMTYVNNRGMIEVAVVSSAGLTSGEIQYGILRSYTEIKDYCKIHVLVDGEATTVKWDWDEAKASGALTPGGILHDPGTGLVAIELDGNEVVSIGYFEDTDLDPHQYISGPITGSSITIDEMNRMWVHYEAEPDYTEWYTLDDEVIVYVYDLSDEAWTVKAASYLDGLKNTATITRFNSIMLYDTNKNDKEYYNIAIVVKE